MKVTLPALDQEVLEAELLEEKRLYQKLFVLPKNPLLATPEQEVLALRGVRHREVLKLQSNEDVEHIPLSQGFHRHPVS